MPVPPILGGWVGGCWPDPPLIHLHFAAGYSEMYVQCPMCNANPHMKDTYVKSNRHWPTQTDTWTPIPHHARIHIGQRGCRHTAVNDGFPALPVFFLRMLVTLVRQRPL